MDAQEQDIVIFDFKNPAACTAWQVINDTVMGGVSESSLQPTSDGYALFAGCVSLKHFGGFCSTSSRAAGPYDLSHAQGIAIRVKGDGKHYKLTVKTDTGFSGFSYQFQFVTKQDAWMTVRAPFRDFVARFRGALLPDAPPLDTSAIRSFGFVIGDKQEGPFRLKIECIKAYGSDALDRA